jgi:Predicted RNA-binding protein (contains KH domains)
LFYVSVPDDKLELAKRVAEVLEKRLGIKVVIDEANKALRIMPGEADSYIAFKAVDVFKAIAMGFSEHDALKLISEDYALHVIELKDYTKSPEDAKRLKGRVIGEKGKTKKIIQEYTGVNILVGDWYIAILGRADQADIAKNAVEMLLEGKEHKTVYNYLNKAELNYKSRSW